MYINQYQCLTMRKAASHVSFIFMQFYNMLVIYLFFSLLLHLHVDGPENENETSLVVSVLSKLQFLGRVYVVLSWVRMLDTYRMYPPS